MRQGQRGSKQCQLAGTSSNTSLICTQQECRHQLVHHDAGNAATNIITPDRQLKIIRKTECSTNRKEYSLGCKFIHTVVNSGQLTVSHTVGVRRELRDQFIAPPNRKPPWSSKAFVRTVRETEQHDIFCSEILADGFLDKHPWEWTKQTSITLELAMEVYLVQVIAASHSLKQQLSSCGYSTSMLPWQGKEVVYSWYSPTRAWHWIWLSWWQQGFVHRNRGNALSV